MAFEGRRETTKLKTENNRNIEEWEKYDRL